LANQLNAGQKLKVTVIVLFTHVLKPFPSYILQKDQQFVTYEGNQFVFGPYQTKKQTTTFKLAPGSLESYSKIQPVKQDGSSLIYGPYENVEAFKSNDLRIHYENNSPFLVVTSMTRVLEVSHWGNVAVEETIEIVHTGAILKGSFSRFDFQRDQRGNDKQPCVKTFRTVLPAAARDVYYRDEIGNISTSHLRQSPESVELEIRPRFPLFGGWKTNYYIGYNVPSYNYLFSSGNNFGLKMRFIDHIFDNFVVDDFTLKIILPEGAKNFKFTPPYPVKRNPDELHYTYLDVSGRPVIVARKNNLVEEHIADFELTYTFDRWTMIFEPLMIVITFYILFFVVIVYVRLDFTIAKDQAVEGKLKVAGLMEQVQNLQNQRSSTYENLVEAVNKYRNNQQVAALTASKKKFETEEKELAAEFLNVQTLLKAENPEYAEKINELNRLDRQAKDQLLLTWVPSVEKLVSGKFTKAQFSDAEKLCRQKLDELKEKMDNIVYAL
jgi:oligosaccharyltransferase complex subunit alpha (ribophorin I)